VDQDPELDRVGSASFCQIQTLIGIGIQGIPIRIGVNSKQKKFQYAVKNT
jgi:hypothetical protein